jgi:DNA mismatch repair protein MutS
MDGAVDKSYGINVAKLAELPEEVINESWRLLEEFETKDGKSKSKVHQYSLDLVEENHDELRDYLKNVNVNEITPIEALNILDHIKKIS